MKTYASNPKANFDYQILEKLETGLVLRGHEVKSIRNGKISIKGSFVKIVSGEAFLIGATLSPYQPGNVPENYDPQRSIKLLLKKKELKYLIGKSEEAGITLVSVKVYGSHGLIKLEIGVARGKKKYDKREIIKKRETERDIARRIK